MPESEDDMLLNTSKAAEHLGVHPNTIRRWVEMQRLHPVEDKGPRLRVKQYLFRRSELDALAGQSARPAREAPGGE